MPEFGRAVTITGDKKIDRKLKRLKTSSQRKIGRAMTGAMQTELLRGIRSVVPPKQKSLKKTLGRRNKRNKKTGVYEAKVGFGVGKQAKSKKNRDPRKPGVGITKSNVHWFILGTVQRIRSTGASTGEMPKSPDYIARGFAKSERKAIAKAHEVGRRKVLDEAKKG